MKLKISSFANAGDHEKERLVIRVLADTDVGEYLVMCSSVSSQDGATAGSKSAYWFPDKEVKVGDLVVLYSKSGRDSQKKLENDTTAHFFYWGQDKAIWGTSNRGAVLMLSAEWEFTRSTFK